MTSAARGIAKQRQPLIVAVGRVSALILMTMLCIGGLIAVGKRNLPSGWMRPGWPYGYFTHAAQLAVALGFIAILGAGPQFGLRSRPGWRYLRLALQVGAVSGVLMLMVDYYPDLLRRHPPPGPYDPSLGNMVPWLVMQGCFVGISEEALFRSLFVGYFRALFPARLKAGRVEVSVAGVAIAVVFSLAHADAFWREPLVSALGQQVYATGLGIFYAYLFEQSGAIVAPVIAHNAGDFVEWCLCFALRAWWQY